MSSQASEVSEDRSNFSSQASEVSEDRSNFSSLASEVSEDRSNFSLQASEVSEGRCLTVPALETALVVDGMGWFFEEVKALVVKEMIGKEPFTMKTARDVTTVTMKMSVTPPPLAWQPVIRFEGKSGRLIVACNLQFSLTGSLSQVLTTMGIGTSLALPAFNSARGEAKEAQSMNNARQVAVACIRHASENEGKFPAALVELADKELIPREMLKCANPVTGEMEEWIYHSGLTNSSEATEILLAAPSVTADFQRLVVYRDGAAAFITEEEYTTKMKKP